MDSAPALTAVTRARTMRRALWFCARPMYEIPVNQFTDVAHLYDNLMAVVPYRQWVDYVERLWEWFGAQPRVVLDLACGTGNVALELHRRGYEVEGVDNSAPMLRMARRKARGRFRLYQQDARALDLPRTYDACVSLFDSLNYLIQPEDLASAFQGVHRHLVPGGVFIFDVNTIRALELGMFNQTGHGRDPSLHYVWKSQWHPETRLCAIDMEFHLQTATGTRTFYERHVQRGYTLDEIRGALESTGCEVLGVFEAFTFHAPTARTDRYYFVARRE
ncbi:MAG: methyltransferase domain-containing protein [Armatimonadetes bacterium]|nr:methyltransferase domain-containing protein [Armatimonadota bacterium]